jgi:hypothetical protein
MPQQPKIPPVDEARRTIVKYILALVVAFVFSAPAWAQHAHGAQKGPNGGQMEDVAGVHAELLTSSNAITVNIFNEDGKPLDTKGYSGSVLIASGSNRETVSLAPWANNALKGEARGPVASGATITLLIKTDAGKTGQARFKG